MKRKDNKKRKNNFMDPAYEGNPYNPMTFTIIPGQSTITINEDLLNQDDQIGIFDGSNLVGVHTGIINGVVQIACNAQETPSDGGFVAGNPVTFKLYDSKKDVVIEGSNLISVDTSVSPLSFSPQGSGQIYSLIGISDNSTSATVQIIHNSASPTVDIYVDSILAIENFVYRTATELLTLPTSFTVGIAPAGGSVIAEFPFSLEDGGSYVVVATGLLGNMDTPFNLAATGTTFGASTNDLVGLEIYHGSTDAPSVDISANGEIILTNNLSYGNFSGFQEVPVKDYTLGVAPTGGDNIAEFFAPLSTLNGASVVVFASGFLSGEKPMFGLFAVLNSGAVLALPATGINGCMDPSACNYNSEATLDNGSCNYNAILSLYDSYGDGWSGNSLTINGINYTMDSGDFTSFNLCFDVSSCTQITYNAEGTWSNENFWDITNNSGTVLVSGEDTSVIFGDSCKDNKGCNDPLACNYDVNVEIDDGSCKYPVNDCTDCDGNYIEGEDQCGVCNGNNDCLGSIKNPETILPVNQTYTRDYVNDIPDFKGDGVYHFRVELKEDTNIRFKDQSDNILGVIDQSKSERKRKIKQNVKGYKRQEDQGTSYIAGTYIFIVIGTIGSYPGEFSLSFIFESVILGCDDVLACNYNPQANVNDGSCLECPDPGCTAGICGDPHILTFGGNRCELPHIVEKYNFLTTENLVVNIDTMMKEDIALVNNVYISYKGSSFTINLNTLDLVDEANFNFQENQLGPLTKEFITEDSKFRFMVNSEKNGLLIKSKENLTQANSSGVLMSDDFDECIIKKLQ